LRLTAVAHVEDCRERGEQYRVALETDRELDRAARLERLRRQRAPGDADDRDRLAVERDQRDPRPGHRRDPHRLLELEARDRVEVRRLMEHHAVRARLAVRGVGAGARHHGQNARRPDDHQVGVVAVEREPRGRRAGAVRE